MFGKKTHLQHKVDDLYRVNQPDPVQIGSQFTLQSTVYTKQFFLFITIFTHYCSSYPVSGG